MNRRTLCALLAVCALNGGVSFAQKGESLRDVAYRNVTFKFDASLAKEFLAETVAAVPLVFKDEKPDGVAPEHIMITLRDSYVPAKRRELSGTYSHPRIYVLPTADATNKNFDVEFPTSRRAADQLKAYLQRRTHSAGDTIPFLPWADLSQAFIAKRKLIRFRNGRGVIFLTQYQQERIPVCNAELVYTFQGLTDDNAWYVSAVFPVSAPGLPTSPKIDDEAAFAKNYDRYILQTAGNLDKLSARNFTPTLTVLENAIRSLKVSPNVAPH